MFGIGEFSAIINPPQCGILAVGGGRSELGKLPSGGTNRLKRIITGCAVTAAPVIFGRPSWGAGSCDLLIGAIVIETFLSTSDDDSIAQVAAGCPGFSMER